MKKYDAYLLTKPDEGNTYSVLLVDQDRVCRMDKLIWCTFENLKKLYASPEYCFQDITIIDDDDIFCSHKVAVAGNALPEVEFNLAEQFTLFDIFETLIFYHAEINLDNMWYPLHGLSFSMKSDKITYVTTQSSNLIWETADCSFDNTLHSLKLQLCAGGFHWLKEQVNDCVKYISGDNDKIICSLDIDRIPCVCSQEYSILRFHMEELQVLLSTYQQVRAQLHGIECGSWLMHQLLKCPVDMFSHKKPRALLSSGKVQFCYDIDFPNAEYCSQKLIENRAALDELMKSQSIEAFCEYLLPFSGCSSQNAYFKLFAAGMLSQLTEFNILKDHELRLNVDLMQTTLTTLAARIFSYKITMSAFPIAMPNEIPLCSGKCLIVREESYASE